ncbi:hypothetical protein C9374_002470 [Naegleria lovaniensis]|uniref:Uncharacterized protein n=1 Tax=Naegleria lovaniensis TaxID=51637 RepID=A0AA88KMP4_NAELO|nr:uncharacterized protein C9374_002470 [Naegleria lovaniensis]KAG2386726.1 hypothetical protein C9374_002470 [Naegleria lovaniensis]
MKESFEQFIQKDLGINENQNEKNYLLPLNNVDMSMIIKDEIFDEYMAIFGENGRFQENLDDSEFEKKLSTLFSNFMNKLFIDEMKLVMDSIEGIIILENTHQLHQNLLRKLIENDICTVRKFPHLKSLKFMNSQGCAILPSFCSMNTFNIEKTTTQARTYDAKLFVKNS